MPQVTHKIGDTFFAECTYFDDDGAPANLTEAGVTVRSSVLSQDGVTRYELTVEVLDQDTYPGRYDISADTAEWSPRWGQWDIQYVDNDGFVISTETVRINLTTDITV